MPPAPLVNSTANTRRSNPQSPSSFKMATEDETSLETKRNVSSSPAAIVDEDDDARGDDTDNTRESSLPPSPPTAPLSLVDSSSSNGSELDKFSLDGEEVVNDKEGCDGGIIESHDGTEKYLSDQGKYGENIADNENMNEERADDPETDCVENFFSSSGAVTVGDDSKRKGRKSNNNQNDNITNNNRRKDMNRENIPWWQFSKRSSLQDNASSQANNWKNDRNKRSQSAHNFLTNSSVTLHGGDEGHSQQQQQPGLFGLRINKSHNSERWGGAKIQRENRDINELDGSAISHQSDTSKKNFHNYNRDRNTHINRRASSSSSSWTNQQNSNFNDSQSSLLHWDDGLPPDPKSKQDVETIVETMKSHSIVVNPLERALLEDMANTDDARLKTRWKGERMLMVSSLRGDGGLALCESIRDLDEMCPERNNSILEEREEDVNEENGEGSNHHHDEDSDENDDESLDMNNEYAAKYMTVNGDDKTQELNFESSSSVGTEELEDGSDVPCSRWKHRDQKKEEEAALLRRQSSIESLPDLKSKVGGDENEDVVCDWGSSDLCKMKENKGRVSKVDVVDDVSSIGSSVHSGRISGSKRGRQSRERGVSARRSFLSSFRWNSALNQNAKDSFGDDCVQGDDDDDTKLEEEIFARQDAEYEKIIQDANELMSKVNKSVLAMGNEAPFRPVEEVVPSLKNLHKNLLLQMDGLGTNLRHVRLTGRRKHRLSNASKRHLRDSAFEGSIISLNSNTSEGSHPPSPNNTKAMDDFIEKQMGRSNLPSKPSSCKRSSLITITHSVSITTSSCNKPLATSIKNYTAYLPNYMWYQFNAVDPSSQIRPTSLCSGTGITGGEQYLDRKMLDVFDMFGSYFVGAFGTFKEDDDGDGNPKRGSRRAAFWMESIDEEDSMTNESMSGYDSEMTLDLSVLDDDDMGDIHVDIDQPVDTETKIELLEKAIADLRRSQIK